MSLPFIEETDQTRARRDHLDRIRDLVGDVYPNQFERSRVVNPEREDTITSIVERFGPLAPKAATKGEGAAARPSPEEIARVNAELNNVAVRVSGRLAVPPRVMGKAAFVHLSDGVARLQIYVRKDEAKAKATTGAQSADGWELFALLDHGDFIGVEGYLFITKTGELSVHVREIVFLAKALVPMPDKMHGISDPEIRQRQRYVDLIAGSLKIDHDAGELTTRQVFERRSQIAREMRRFLEAHGYIEVETPMLTQLASGAAARPFVTHHNALGIDLYARIAPELYLKRLLVGGFERVFELNRNFRNEGIDRTHNPEFTMLEFYCAYMDATGMIDFCESMLRSITRAVTGRAEARYGAHEIDFARAFERLTMKEAIAEYWPTELSEIAGEAFDIAWLDDVRRLRLLYLVLIETGGGIEAIRERLRDTPESERPAAIAGIVEQARTTLARERERAAPDEAELALLVTKLFEDVAEPQLIQPTFITDFPKAISPLSKASPADPAIAERFELYVAGMEVANGFSELNDPTEQHERFLDQTRQRERGDDEAMPMDEDYVRALAYGMPPAAGIGIGFDRVVMILTNQRSIRDVILFPHMRPQRHESEQTSEDESTSGPGGAEAAFGD